MVVVVSGEIVGGYPVRGSDLLLPIGNLTVPVGREATLECVVRESRKSIKVTRLLPPSHSSPSRLLDFPSEG